MGRWRKTKEENMYKLFFIAKNNMKKQKGDMITFFILTFIAAFLMWLFSDIVLGRVMVSVLGGMGALVQKVLFEH